MMTVREQDAISAAQQAGVSPGDYITLQSEGQINNPHQHGRWDNGPEHVDAWRVENDGGTYSADKLHSDDR